MPQRSRVGNRNSPAIPAAPAMMIADVTLSNDSHAIGRIIPNPMNAAHQLSRFFSVLLMRSTLNGELRGRFPRVGDIQAMAIREK